VEHGDGDAVVQLALHARERAVTPVYTIGGYDRATPSANALQWELSFASHKFMSCLQASFTVFGSPCVGEFGLLCSIVPVPHSNQFDRNLVSLVISFSHPHDRESDSFQLSLAISRENACQYTGSNCTHFLTGHGSV
jgi:hypothetical protein